MIFTFGEDAVAHRGGWGMLSQISLCGQCIFQKLSYYQTNTGIVKVHYPFINEK